MFLLLSKHKINKRRSWAMFSAGKKNGIANEAMFCAN